MAGLSITGQMKVGTLQKRFLEEFGLNLRVYDGRSFADETKTLAAVRKTSGTSNPLSVARNMKVGSLESKFLQEFGLKVQVSGSDDSYLCDDDLTINAAQIADEKKIARKERKEARQADDSESSIDEFESTDDDFDELLEDEIFDEDEDEDFYDDDQDASPSLSTSGEELAASFRVDEPDDDGDMSSDIELSVTNSSSEVVRQVRYSTAVLGHDGSPVSFSSSNTEDVVLDPGETESINVYAGYLKSSSTAGARDDLDLIVNCRLMTRDFIKLGTFELPRPGNVHSEDIEIDSDNFSPRANMQIHCAEPDDDGDVNVTVRLLVTNTTNQFLEGVELKAQMLDEDDSEITEASCDELVPPNGMGMLEANSYGSKKELASGQVKITLCVYNQLCSLSTQVKSVPND
jgi:hypothetical protein